MKKIVCRTFLFDRQLLFNLLVYDYRTHSSNIPSGRRSESDPQQYVLAKRENEVTECIAWGGSYKETASLLQISVRTVDNTLRKVKEKLGLNKINEISAWWFCTHHNISLDLSPFVRRQISVILLCIFISGEISISTDSPYTTRRSRRSRTEYRARRQETSINQPYII